MKTNKIAQFILAVAFFVSASGFQYSNAQAFEEGNNNVSIGYGFVTFAGAVFNSYEDQNNYDFSITGPIFVGYRSGTWKFESTDPNGTNDLNISNSFPLGFETTIGARYYFTDNIGLYAETGLAKAVIQAGLSFKF